MLIEYKIRFEKDGVTITQAVDGHVHAVGPGGGEGTTGPGGGEGTTGPGGGEGTTGPGGESPRGTIAVILGPLVISSPAPAAQRLGVGPPPVPIERKRKVFGLADLIQEAKGEV